MFYRRKSLPHWQPDPAWEAWLFITWRLAGSIPMSVLRAQHLESGKRFVAIDCAADRADRGPVWLADVRIAELVKRALLSGEQGREWYKLAAWVIMPNHVHVLLQPHVPLAKITHWLKGSTSCQANKIPARRGQAFWSIESFDRVIRSDREFDRTVRYIESNRVNAGLVNASHRWPWSSARTGSCYVDICSHS